MKTKESNPKSGIVSMRLVVFTAVVSLLPILLFAAGPQWWTDRGLLNGNDANDYVPANQGQLKHFATTAFDEFNANLPGGVGDMTPPDESGSNAGTGYKLTALINSWSTLQPDGSRIPVVGQNTNDYASINLGQLKNVTKLFYDRLIEAGYHQGPLVSGTYPWIGHTANDYTMANIGQVKNLFSFDVSSYVAPPVAQNASMSIANDTVIPLSITLLASGTSARPLTYTVLTSPGHGTLSGDAPNLTYTPALNYAGTDTLTFKANDGLHDSNTATVTILTKAPPRVYAGANQAIPISGSATLAGTVVDLDTPSAQLTYSWTRNSGPGSVTFANASALQTTAAFSAAGSYQLTLVVSDGEFSRASITTIEVNAAAATPPTVSLTSPANGTVQTKPVTISLAATATASTGTIVKVEFYQGSHKLGESTAAPYAFDWQVSYAGVYALSAKATDSQGATAFSSAAIIKVINDGDSNDPPINEPPSGPAPDPTNADQDTDGDGVPDSQDDYPDDPNRTKDVPIQSYAAIDISGTIPGDKDVSMVALDDQNNAAFGYYGENKFSVGTWASGSATAVTDISPLQEITHGPGDWGDRLDKLLKYSIAGLTTAGKVCGSVEGDYMLIRTDPESGEEYMIDFTNYSCGFTCAPGGSPSFCGGDLSAAKSPFATYFAISFGDDNGFAGYGTDRPDWRGTLQKYGAYYPFICSSGNYTYFVSSVDGSYPPSQTPNLPTGSEYACPADIYLFWPGTPNDSGCAIGYSSLDGGVIFWNGSSLTRITGGVAGLNNQNQVIGTDSKGGFVWQNNIQTYITDLLPKKFQKQIKNIAPKLISNSGTDADGNVSYNILFKADSIEGPGTGTLVNRDFVLNVNATSGTNIVSQVTIPESVPLASLNNYNSINGSGMISALAKITTIGTDGTPSVSQQKALLLMPFGVDFITRSPETGGFQNLGGLIEKSDPRPSLKFTNVEATITPSGELQITVNGEARDCLSEFLASGEGAISSIELFLNGDSIGTVDDLNAGDSRIAPLAPWQHGDSTKTFTKVVTVSGITPGAHTLVAKTNPNALGQQGWASAGVVVEKIQPGDIMASGVPTLSFSISQDFSDDTQNGFTLILNGSQSVSMVEAAAQQGVFEGTAIIDGASRPIRAMLPTSLSLNTGMADMFGAKVNYEGSSGRIYTIEGAFAETGFSTRQFNSATPLSTVESYENLQVAGVMMNIAQEGRAFEPVVIRVTMPDAVSDWIGENGWFKAELNGTDVQLKKNDDVIPGDQPPAGLKYYYITASNTPATYLAHDDLVGEHYPAQAASDCEFRLRFKKRVDNKVLFERGASISEFALLNEDEEQEELAALGNRMMMPMTNESASAEYNLEDVNLIFGVLFGKVGSDLMTLYKNAGVQVEVTSWFGLSTYSFDGIRPDEADGLPSEKVKTAKISINRDRCKTSVDAATALFNALQNLHQKSAVLLRTSLDPGVLDWQQILDANIAGDPDTGDLDAAWRNSRLTPVKDTVEGFTEAVKFGMGFTVAGNAIVTTADAGEALREHNTVGAAVCVGMVLTPAVVGKMWKYCKRMGFVWRCELPGNVTIEFTEGILNALRSVPKNATPLQKLEALLPLIDNGTISRDVIEAMWRGGYLKSSKPREKLAADLGGAFLNKLTSVAHHDYPVTKELDFVLAGIDINAGSSSGRWLPAPFHGRIHNAPGWPTSGRGGPFVYQWDRFFAEFTERGSNATKAEIETFRDRLRAATSDFSKSVEEIAWPYPNPN